MDTIDNKIKDIISEIFKNRNGHLAVYLREFLLTTEYKLKDIELVERVIRTTNTIETHWFFRKKDV